MRSSTKKINGQPDAFVLPRYDEIALVLQGGGALGSYQAGVYEGLAEAGVQPNWIAGVSIGALNPAIIAGNAPENRVEAEAIAAEQTRIWEEVKNRTRANHL